MLKIEVNFRYFDIVTHITVLDMFQKLTQQPLSSKPVELTTISKFSPKEETEQLLPYATYSWWLEHPETGKVYIAVKRAKGVTYSVTVLSEFTIEIKAIGKILDEEYQQIVVALKLQEKILRYHWCSWERISTIQLCFPVESQLIKEFQTDNLYVFSFNIIQNDISQFE